jgi:anti-sigma factor (TIGR02949 family)
MISCDEAVRRLWEYLDEDLDTHEHAQVADHLSLCRRCCGEAEFTDALQGVLRSARGPDLPPDTEAHLIGFLDELEREVP